LGESLPPVGPGSAGVSVPAPAVTAERPCDPFRISQRIRIDFFNVRTKIFDERVNIMTYSATKLRQNLYNILDQVIEKGIPIEIERKGVKLKIVPENPVSKWDRLEPHNIVNGDPEDLVSINWAGEWSGEQNL
jgi:hypothetical protein